MLPANDLQTLKWAKRTVSFIVATGTRQLCNNANFGGTCFTVHPGKYRPSHMNGAETTVVSLWPVAATAP
jgi:hypothetical protein